MQCSQLSTFLPTLSPNSFHTGVTGVKQNLPVLIWIPHIIEEAEQFCVKILFIRISASMDCLFIFVAYFSIEFSVFLIHRFFVCCR